MLKEEFEHLLQLLEQGKTIAGHSSAFSNDLNRQQTNLLLQVGGRMDAPSIEKGMPALNRVLGKLQGEVKQLISRFAAGESSQAILKNFKDIAFSRYKEAFLLGAKASGNPFYKANVPLTDKDLSFLRSAVNKEASFFNHLLRDASIQMQTGSLNKAKMNRRADMYGDAAKAQFWNGTVKGMGDDVEIHWILGQAEHCPDCPILASKTYTWETLPTTPGAGDTACLSNCKCHLEIIKRPPAAEWGQGTTQTESPTWSNVGLGARWCSVINKMGQEMSGGIVNEFAELWQRLYKARQMVTLSTTAEQKQAWVGVRRVLNNEIIELAKAHSVRTLPEVSVSKLLTTARGAISTGAKYLIPPPAFVNNMEVVFIRGDFWTSGILSKRGNVWEIKNAQGQTFEVNDASDIILGYKPPTNVPSEYHKTAPGEVVAGGEESFTKWERGQDVTTQPSASTISEREIKALQGYTGTESEGINEYLRTYEGKVPEKESTFRDSIVGLDTLSKKVVTNRNILVYRGLRFRDSDSLMAFIDKLRGGSFIDNGFISTSLDPAVATSFMSESMNVIKLEIEISKGSFIIDVGKIEQIKNLAPTGEKEIILPRGSKFFVKQIEEQAPGIFTARLRLISEKEIIK